MKSDTVLLHVKPYLVIGGYVVMMDFRTAVKYDVSLDLTSGL